MADTKSTSTSSSGKRKRAGKITYYAIKEGHNPGIYYSWADVQEQIMGYKDPKHESFSLLADAEDFMRTGHAIRSKPSKQEYFYAVHTDRIDQVFTDWASASAAMRGHKGIKQQKFRTAEEAWAHLDRLKGVITPSDVSAPISTKSETKTTLKKLKKNDGSAIESATDGYHYELGEGPLPPGAQDGFDDTIFFDPINGFIEPKTEAQSNARKLHPTGEFSGPLTIYTDGSSLGNGKVGAIAGVGVYFGPIDPRNVSELLVGSRQTNQRAELMAISRALDIAPIDKDVHIYSDSNYSIKCVTEWSKRWEENSWRNSAGKPVENKDIIEPIVNRIDERRLAKAGTKFTWLKGHNKDPGNERADSLATCSSKKARTGIGPDYLTFENARQAQEEMTATGRNPAEQLTIMAKREASAGIDPAKQLANITAMRARLERGGVI